MAPRLPRRWTCPAHGAPTSFGCSKCDAIQGELLEYIEEAVVARKRDGKEPRSQALLTLAADLVVRFAADGKATPHQTYNRRVALAAAVYIEAVPGPRKKAA